MKTVKNISIGMLSLLLASGTLALGGEETMVAASKRVISPYKAVFRGLSKTTPIKTSVDSPLLGNGDMGVCLSEIMVRKEDGKARQVANGPRFGSARMISGNWHMITTSARAARGFSAGST